MIQPGRLATRFHALFTKKSIVLLESNDILAHGAFEKNVPGADTQQTAKSCSQNEDHDVSVTCSGKVTKDHQRHVAPEWWQW